MPKLKPFNAFKGLTITKPLALAVHLALAGAGSAGVYYLVSDYQQQQAEAQLNQFARQATAIIERHSQNWQQQSRLLAQQPMLRSTAVLKAVIPVDGTVPPSLNYADQDLLNRTRTAPTQPEISGTGNKALISTALAMPTGGYVIIEWSITPLAQDLQAITPDNIQLKFSQQLSGASPLEVLRIHSNGNDGTLKAIPLSTKGWQLAIGPASSAGHLPLWSALISLLGSLLPLLMWGLRKEKNQQQIVTTLPTPLDQDDFPDPLFHNPTNVIPPQPVDRLNNNPELAPDVFDEQQASVEETPSVPPVAAEVDATEAFDELDLLQQELEQPVEPQIESQTLEFTLEDTLLPDAELNVAATSFPAYLFRAYDIRGSIDDLSTELVGQIGRALGSQLRQQDQYQVVVGYDARTSSSSYAKIIRQALSDCGLSVIDIGQVTTPLCYFAAAQHDGNGIMITASHNPGDENGVKWLIQHQSPTPESIQALMQRINQKDFVEGLGNVREHTYNEDYLSLLQDDVLLSQPVQVSIDGMHGSAGPLALAAFEAAGCTVSSLNTEPNGMFPNGAPDPSKAEYIQELSNDIVISGSQLGFAFDGDGDRLVVLDSQGNVVSPDYLITLFARMCLDSNPGSDIIFDVKCSRMISSIVTSEGGRPVMIRTGNTFLRQALHSPEYQAVFAGEYSGHYFFNDQRSHGQDDGIYAALRLLEWLDLRGQTLEEALAELPQRISTPDLYLELQDINASALLASIEQDAAQLDGAKISTIDGIRLDFDYGFGIMRPSNTGNYLTARFDADTTDNLQFIRLTFANLLREHDERLAQLILE
ncbi:phosphomannomutase/phosphoglucomutase [Alkanindiges sp. WGS2144]|uniref:phosphomannomutase/phosphoglucomutase n=1 Tax=Alkanindiges sp. WGS2144 TaxID=3366808 RepID=UPI0037502ECD